MSLSEQLQSIETVYEQRDRSRSQSDGALVFGLVDQIQTRESDSKQKQRYGRLCYQLPLWLQENGLAQTLGFLVAKSAKENKEVAESWLALHLAVCLWSWMWVIKADRLQQELPTELQPAEVVSRTQQVVLDASLGDYILLMRRARQFSEWFKRHAEGRFETNNHAK